MEKPSPRSPFTNSIICGSELHIASPVSGSNERDFNLDKLVSVLMVPEEAKEPSDLAFTNLSVAGIKLFKLPPKILCNQKINHIKCI